MSGKRHSMILMAAAVLAAAVVSADCSKKPAPPDPSLGPSVVIENAKGERWTVTVELARTLDEQRKGLMYRWSLPQDHGMLFIYHNDKVLSFWMKNTRIPLDMIFIGADKKIAGIVANAEPYTETPRSVGVPSRYVLEVSGGECEKHNVTSGDQLYFYGFKE